MFYMFTAIMIFDMWLNITFIYEMLTLYYVDMPML